MICKTGKRLLTVLIATTVLLSAFGYADLSKSWADEGTVYISISHDGSFVKNGRGTTDTGYMAYVPVDLSELDDVVLSDYGIRGYGHDADGDGKADVTLLHLFAYVLDQYNKSGTANLNITGSPGSLYFKNGFWTNEDGTIWDENLNYYVNGAYPLESPGWGATADTIPLNDGDFIDVAHFTSWGFFGDDNAGFQYFAKNDEIIHEYTMEAKEKTELNLCKTVADSENYTSSLAPYCTTVYYGKSLYAADGYANAAIEGNAAVFDLVFEKEGDYWIWTDGDYGTNADPENIVNAPAVARIHVTGEHTHKYGAPQYAWNDDNTMVTATRVCTNKAHVESETVEAASEVTKAPTCEKKGETTYTSGEFRNEAFAVQRKTVEDIAPLGHNYGEWKVTRKATTTAEGEKQRVCGNDPSHVERCAIPKIVPSPSAGSVAATGNIAKKTMTISWGKVKNATDYKIAYRLAGRKWTEKWTGGKNKITLKKMKKNGLYEFRIMAVRKNGSTLTRSAWSKVSYRFYAVVKQTPKAGRKSFTVKLGKLSKASGYQIQYGMSRKTSAMKIQTLKGSAKTKFKRKGLKSGKRYYVRTRPYKKYSGHTYLGLFSTYKSVRIK